MTDTELKQLIKDCGPPTILKLEAGDIVVLRYEQFLDTEHLLNLKRQWDEHYPSVDMVILDNAPKLDIIRPPQSEPRCGLSSLEHSKQLEAMFKKQKAERDDFYRNMPDAEIEKRLAKYCAPPVVFEMEDEPPCGLFSPEHCKQLEAILKKHAATYDKFYHNGTSDGTKPTGVIDGRTGKSSRLKEKT